MNFKNRTATQWGTWGEKIAIKWLQKQGWYVIPVSLIDNGGAPKAVGLLKSIVLPDLQIAGKGGSRWVEVKTKRNPIHFRKARQWRHGIDQPKWDAYLSVETESQIPGDLAIIQIRPGPEAEPEPMLLIAPFDQLQNSAKHEPGKDGPMVYWATEKFEIFPLEDCPIPPLPNLRLVEHPWEKKDKRGNAPRFDRSTHPRLFPHTNQCVDCGEDYNEPGLLTRCQKRHKGGKLLV